ncbi:MAG: chloride channel protein [Eubacterium sp.]|jgi:H+/Cl- antiporter ClcA
MEERKYSQAEYIFKYSKVIVLWIILAVVIGIACGFTGALFYNGVAGATSLRLENPWLLYALPLAGIAIVGIYKALNLEGKGTDTVIEKVRDGTPLRIALLPAIFIGTILTHLCGGSAGREGAALQIGGCLGNGIGRVTRLSSSDLKIATMTGMAAFFSAIFGTPLTATIFVVMFVNVGTLHEMAIFPCFLASWTAIWISEKFGVQAMHFDIAPPEPEPFMMLRMIVFGILCGLVSTLMCGAFHGAGKLYERVFKNSFIRVIAGGLLVILLTFIVGTRDYNGAGTEVIARAIENGEAFPAAFLLKILFTAVTLGAGYKGGEIVPTFFIGATFGCVIGPLLGIPAGFAAAVGMVVMFAGATNTLIAPMFLAVEVFGISNLHLFAAAGVMSYICSGYNGLYSSQNIRFSKLHSGEVNIRTNHNDRVDFGLPSLSLKQKKQKQQKQNEPDDKAADGEADQIE